MEKEEVVKGVSGSVLTTTYLAGMEYEIQMNPLVYSLFTIFICKKKLEFFPHSNEKVYWTAEEQQ